MNLVCSAGVSVDLDGKVTAFETITAVPPAVNWQRLMCQVKNTNTNEIYQAELLNNAGTYSAVVAGLRPNQPHTVVCWAVNSNNRDGATSAPVSFTSATSSAVPSAPASAVAGQLYTRELDYSWSKVTPAAGAPPIDFYIVEESVGGGAFAEVFRGDATAWKRVGVTTGSAYQFRVKAQDRAGNQSAYATSNSLTASQMITDSYIQNSGIGGISIANGSINQGRLTSSTGSGSGTLTNPGDGFAISFPNDYVMSVSFWSSPQGMLRSASVSAGLGLKNDAAAGSMTYNYSYRSVS